MVLSRSIHEIIWALLFVSAVGLGALPGILAVAMRSVGFISKITAEAIENIDPKPIEAIRAVGGNRFQVLWYGIMPQILPVVLGTMIFEWDINIRRAAVMGLVGAGGLGLVFFRQMAHVQLRRRDHGHPGHPGPDPDRRGGLPLRPQSGDLRC
jgi:phosphonate transport system permease protein